MDASLDEDNARFIGLSLVSKAPRRRNEPPAFAALLRKPATSYTVRLFNSRTRHKVKWFGRRPSVIRYCRGSAFHWGADAPSGQQQSAAIEGWCKGDMHIAIGPANQALSRVRCSFQSRLRLITPATLCASTLALRPHVYGWFRKDQRHADSQARTLRHMVVHESQVLMDRQTNEIEKHTHMNRK